MTPEERERAKGNRIFTKQRKVCEEREAPVKRLKEQCKYIPQAKWKESKRKKDARRLLHKKVCELLDAGVDRNQIAVAIDRENNPNVVDMIKRIHLLGQSGGCTCGYDHKAPHQGRKMVKEELVLPDTINLSRKEKDECSLWMRNIVPGGRRKQEKHIPELKPERPGREITGVV